MSAPATEPKVWRLSSSQQLLFFVTCGFPINFLSMISFLVPLRARELDAPIEMVGLIVGAGAVLGMLLAVPAGALSDKLGPRQAFVLGALLDALAAIAFWVVDNYWAMLGIQLLRGLPHSMAWVASQSYLASIGGPQDRAVLAGRFSFASGIGGLLTPIMIGAMASWVGYQNGFAFAAAYCAVTVVMGVVLPDVRTPAGAKRTNSGGYVEALSLLRQTGPRVAVMLTFVRLWINTGWLAFFPIFLAERGFSPFMIGTVVSGSGAVSSLAGLVAHRVAQRTSNQVATAGALALGALGMALSPYLAFFPFVYTPVLFQGVGIGFSMPLVLAMLADDVPPHQRGIAMGLRTCANQAGLMVAPVVTGLLVGSVGLPLGFLASSILCWGLLAEALRQHTRRPARD